ncbi:MAG: hypothetical protein LBV32_01695 [Tannerellaceae bacterium]|jgi:hypothetical protein|nr:hypothetical protein [Tannerellaceae bacterium]
MREKCFIDGRDIFTSFGVTVRKGAYRELLTFPAMKEPAKNDWPEEDGVEVDLETPVLQPRNVTIPFTFAGYDRDAASFIRFIGQPGYREFFIPALGKSWKLRLTGQSENSIGAQSANFALQFADDEVYGIRPEDYPRPSGGGWSIKDCGYELDGIPFLQYGVVVESGLDEVLRSPAIKQNLTRTFSASDGQVYDAGTVFFNSKEVTLKCLFVTAGMDKFRECYTAFFNDLIQPGERFLYCDYTGMEYPCYYRKSSGFNMEEAGERVVCSFSLTLEFTSFRIQGTEYILTTEDGLTIALEDGETEIDMNGY